ncbi:MULTISPECIES: hypothetical protein [unclassified Streptomyces]|uniref:hypothetical protein n=1 Tax=unclassified Streptomyces TaxID=2593676 RepID=UPI00093A803D|nr:hypothetical protein [Streptomyces sp. TSRI0107]OKJ85270.1 hypothetical protein AMK31_14295 [Streptomyces sp. TSRI0107]
MDQPWDKVTAPGTLEDMIEDARAAGFDLQKRTIHDWIARGLLDQPLRRGAGRGSRPGLHSENQRKLFLLLLTKRDEMPKLPMLALIPLSIWLWWGVNWVPTRQALKALATWFGDGARRKQVCHDAALRVLEQLDHPLASETARARLVRLFEAISYRGRMTAVDREELETAARSVFEPQSVFGSTGLVRAVGPSAMPFTVEALLTKTSAVVEAIRVLRDNCMTEELLERAKTLHLRSKREYAELRPTLEAQTAGPLSALFSERTLDEEFNAIGTDLLLVIGLLLTSPRARSAVVGTA